MSQYYDEEIREFIDLNLNSLYQDFGKVKGVHAVDMYDEVPEFREFCQEAFRNACDAKATDDEYSYN